MIRSISTEFALFLAPFVLYAAFLFATRVGVLHPTAWTMQRVARCSSCRSLLVIGSFVVLAKFSGAPPGSTYVPAHIENGKFVPGDDAVTAQLRSSRDAAWLKHGEVKDLLALLDRDGEEARVVGGAVRNALLQLAGRRDRRCDDGDARRGCPPRRGGRLEGRSDRHRARHRHGRHRRQAVRSDDAAAGHRNLRPQGQSRVRPRLAADAQRRDFTINALSATADGTVYDYVGGLADIARAPRALHRRSGAADRRRLFAHPALLSLSRLVWRGRARCGRTARLYCSARRARHACRASGCAWSCSSFCSRRMRRRRLAVMAETGLLGSVLGGVPHLASFENLVKAEAAMRHRARRRAAAGRAWRPGERGCGAAGRAASSVECRGRTARRARSLVARDAVRRRPSGACAPLSSRRTMLRRSRAARLVPLAGRCGRSVVARACKPAAALDARRSFRSRPPTS